jgi:hypothetical protein
MNGMGGWWSGVNMYTSVVSVICSVAEVKFSDGSVWTTPSWHGAHVTLPAMMSQ